MTGCGCEHDRRPWHYYSGGIIRCTQCACEYGHGPDRRPMPGPCNVVSGDQRCTLNGGHFPYGQHMTSDGTRFP